MLSLYRFLQTFLETECTIDNTRASLISARKLIEMIESVLRVRLDGIVDLENMDEKISPQPLPSVEDIAPQVQETKYVKNAWESGFFAVNDKTQKFLQSNL